MRDLERLHDVVEYRVNPSQLRLVFFGVLAVACAIFAVGVSVGKRLEPASAGFGADPLAELDRADRRQPAGAEARRDAPALTYHDELTERPAEAVAAPAAIVAPAPEAVAAAPVPPAAIGQQPAPVSPAPPAEQVEVRREAAVVEEPAPGESAVYTLQVASFETREEATQFASDLRGRGHHVFLVQTSTEDRGTWYRIRVGPFESRREATEYQRRFERTERLPTFLVRRQH